MKLLYTSILLLGIIQLTPAKPLCRFYEANNLTPAKELAEFYKKELNSLAGEICNELKKINKKLLRDKRVQQSEETLMQEFRKNLTHFQQIHEFYLKYGYNETMASTFSNMVNDFYSPEASLNTNSSLLYIKQLLGDVGYDSIRSKYGSVFKKLITEKLLPQFEDLQLTNPTAEFDNEFIEWLDNLQKCDVYECYLKTYAKARLTTKDKFFSYIARQLVDMTILYLNEANVFSQRILRDPLSLPLADDLADILVCNVKHAVQFTDLVDEVTQLFFISLQYHLIKFTFIDVKISYKELQSVLKVLNDLGYDQMDADHKRNYDNFLKNDLLVEYERFKANLTENELQENKSLLESFERLKAANTFEERVEIVNEEVDKKHFENIQI